MSPFIPSSSQNQFLRGGYYSTQLLPSLHAISLNTLYFFSPNHAVSGCTSPSDASSIHLLWLENELASIRQQGHKTIIIGHVAPGRGGWTWFPECFDEYERIVLEYKDVIVGQHFGHQNKDHFTFLGATFAPEGWNEGDIDVRMKKGYEGLREGEDYGECLIDV
jgi:endopolyphosphatase